MMKISTCLRFVIFGSPIFLRNPMAEILIKPQFIPLTHQSQELNNTLTLIYSISMCVLNF